MASISSKFEGIRPRNFACCLVHLVVKVVNGFEMHILAHQEERLAHRVHALQYVRFARRVVDQIRHSFDLACA